MPRKVRELLSDLKRVGFQQIKGGKGSHQKLVHPRYTGAVTLSGKSGDDAKPYQEKAVRGAVEEVTK